mgnify:CR=1 FL=1
MKTIVLLISILTAPAYAQAETLATCSPPYDPSNVIEATLRYSEAMEYIAEGPEACSRQFADQFIEVYRDSWLISDGCLEVTIDDVNKALARRKEISKSKEA